MLRMIGIVCLLLLIGVAEARVDFEHSSILDEFDFQGKDSISIDALCSSSCRIYASITPESKKAASNLLIQLPKGFTSIADVAARVDSTTGQKLYLELTNTNSLIIVNGNSQNAAGPLVLYVVRDGSDYNAEIYEADGLNRPLSHYNAEIYEADGLNRPLSALPQLLTVMSAKPFTLKQAPYDGEAGTSQTVSVKMTGFDAINTGACKNLYHETLTSPFPGFTFEVNGPIITVNWETRGETPKSEISATIGITNMQHVASSGWIGSPGYHGCLDKQPYHSSLYDFHSDFHAEIISEELYIIYMTIETNSDVLHALHFTDPTTLIKYPISNSPSDNPITLYMRIDDLAIDWRPVPDTFFLGRWNHTL